MSEPVMVRYRIDFYDAEGRGLFAIEDAESPFMALRVGDVIEPQRWLFRSELPEGHVYVVQGVSHQVYAVGPKVFHGLRIGVAPQKSKMNLG